MNEKRSHQNNYQLTSEAFPAAVITPSKKRISIGSSKNCDVGLSNEDASAIHAVIEFNDDSITLYNMSEKGTYVNNNRIITAPIKNGDSIAFGKTNFVFNKLKNDSLPKLPLDILNEETNRLHLPKSLDTQHSTKLSYPLAQDPQAQFSEYIFEDSDNIYPIFEYFPKETAVEVVIIFKEQIFSIDYIGQKSGTYFLSGASGRRHSIEFPHLKKREKIPLLNVGEKIEVNLLDGYEICNLTNNKKDLVGKVSIEKDEILVMTKDDIQIFIRGTDAPPLVSRAPFFKNDKTFQKQVTPILALIFFMMTFSAIYKVDYSVGTKEEPARIAKVIYKLPPPEPTPIILHHEKESKVVEPIVAIEQKEQTSNIIQQKITPPTPIKKIEVATKVTKIENKTESLASQQLADKPTLKIVSSNLIQKAPEVAKLVEVPKVVAKSYKFGGAASLKNFSGASSGILASVKDQEVQISNSLGGTKLANKDGDAQSLGESKISVGRFSEQGTSSESVGTGVAGLSKKRAIASVYQASQIKILGAINPEMVRKIMREYIPQLRYCYQKEILTSRDNSKIQGILDLNFQINGNGQGQNVELKNISAELSQKTIDCITRVVSTIQFPKPQGGNTVDVRQPLDFSSEN